MFKGMKQITPAVTKRVDANIQSFLWNAIGNVKEETGKEPDHLQIFELKEGKKDGKTVQEITHSQEQPVKWSKTYYVETPNPINNKIYIIDNESYATMLFSNEY